MRARTLLLSLLLSLVSLAAVLAPPAGASTTQEAILQDDPALEANPDGILYTLREIGVTRVRVGIVWSHLAPKHRPKHFNGANPADYPASAWRVYDTIVRDAQRHGMSLLFLLTGPGPLWARGPGDPRGGPHGQWRPSAADFRAFATAVGRRYSGSYDGLPAVRFWSVWNEPNYGVDLAPQTTSNNTVETGAALYRGLLDAAWSGLSATGHRHDTILFGETAPHGVSRPGAFSGVVPLRFLRALYCVDSRYRELRGGAAAARGCPTTAGGSRAFRARHPALFDASGFADHPYAQGLRPDHSLGSNPDYADLPDIPRLASTLDRLQRVYGSHARLPIWNTEYGYWTNPPERVARVNPTTAALYINWAEYLSWRQPRLHSYSQYQLVDPASGHFASGLVFVNGRAKQPLFDAYRMPLFLPHGTGRRGAALTVWGAVRPAHLTFGTQHASLQWRPNSHGGWQTLADVPITNSRGYFEVHQVFPGSGQVRIGYEQPLVGAITSRTATVTIK